MSINISNISIKNFSNICRTCSQKGDLVSIQENVYLIEMLFTSVHIQIQLNDELPKQICLECIKELNQTYAFISKCKATDAVFRQCLTQQKLINLKENHEKNSKTNKLELTEEIFIKTEIEDNDECISDESSKDSVKRPDINFVECNVGGFENKTKTNEQHTFSCSDCTKSFATNEELVLHLNDCQLKSLLDPMEHEENSDDEFQDSAAPEKSQISLEADIETTKIPSFNVLPELSKKKYEVAYKFFLDWWKDQDKDSYTETVLMEYFSKISKQYKATTLWTQYSMLRTMLNLNNNVNIAKYSKLRDFLKQRSETHQPKKSKTFTTNEIKKFIKEAPDEQYLLIKVAFIMGIMGACRRNELHQMKTSNFNDFGSAVLVTLPDTKTKVVRRFTITGHFYELFKKYSNLRPVNMTDTSFFLNYQRGKCTIQRVGINKFGAMGKQIAKYLKLPNPELYTGHCLCRSSAANLLDA